MSTARQGTGFGHAGGAGGELEAVQPTHVAPGAGDHERPSAEPRGARWRAGHGARQVIRDGRLVSVLVIAGIWQLVAVQANLSVVVLPSPTQVITAWWDVLLHGDLIGAIGISLEALLIGFGVSVLLGVPAGLGMGLVRRFRYALDPYVTILLATPYTAFVPVLMVWTGLGMTTQIVAAFLFSFPFIVINAEAGVREIDSSLGNMARSFETPPLQFLGKVVLPGALSSTFIGLRLGMSHGFKGVFLTEMLISYAGLGGLVTLYGSQYATDHLLAVVATGLVFVLLINAAFEILHRQILPWRRFSQQASR